MKKLNDMTSGELMDFWRKYFCNSRTLARQFFPNMKKGHVRAMKDLALYASNHATWLYSGNNLYARIARKIYDELPPEAKSYIK